MIKVEKIKNVVKNFYKTITTPTIIPTNKSLLWASFK